MSDYNAANINSRDNSDNQEEDFITIDGTVSKIIFQNDENGYTVCEIETDDELAVVNGVMPFLSEGESISAVGKWTVHQSFGRLLYNRCHSGRDGEQSACN